MMQGIDIDRKMLAELAVKEPGIFKELTERVSASL